MSPPVADVETSSGTAALAAATPLDGLPAPAYVCDHEGRIIRYNERAAALWGRRPMLNDVRDRFSGAATLLSPDGSPLPRDRSPTALALADAVPYEGCEVMIVRPDGSRRTVLFYVTPIVAAATPEAAKLDSPQADAPQVEAPQTGPPSTVVGATTILIDVTDREADYREAQAALRESEANFRGFFDSAAFGALQVNSAGRIVRVNDRYCEITGYSREELMQMSPFDLDHPDDRQEDTERVLKALADPAGGYQAEKRYICKDGSMRWVHVAANILRDEQGRPLQTAAVVLDIEERKRFEEALQLADRMKDEFLATLAHELRNPLAPLTSAAELLRDPAHDNEWCKNVIDRQVRHLTRLIDDLLDVSRITRDKLELRKERVELSDVINGALEASLPMLEHCEQTVLTSLPTEPIYLDGDPIRLTQVFTNLLTNAAKFTHGPGTVRVSVKHEPGNVWVSIEDSGIGIASEDLPRIFDKFYQGTGNGERFLDGLGIGLSLVQRLVVLHGGDVEARSTGIGEGSEFIVRLPLASQVSAAAQLSASPLSQADTKRILIVDDNVDGADALGRLLTLMGQQTATEYDGQSALQRAAEFDPDVVLLDLGMPGMDGFEVCRTLRRRCGNGRPKIVALTGWGRKEDLARTKEAGFDAHLVKPIDRARLSQLLAEVETASALA
jgi:PAS domain S-box-containing protein